MKNKIGLIFAGLVILLSFLYGYGVYATEVIDVPDFQEILAVQQIVAKHADWREIYGEVVSVSSHDLKLRVDEKDYVFPISQHTLIFCNGFPASWMALQPVSEQAYFEARIYINTIGNLCLVNGIYNGEEGIIRSYRISPGEIELVLYRPEQNDLRKCRVSKSARLPSISSWLQPERAVFVLYNYKHEIRAVFIEK